MDSGSKLSIFRKFFPRGKFVFCALSLLFLFWGVAANAEVRSKLQWFDSRGEIMDLDWATNVQWIWGPDKTPFAQVIITVPEQLHLTIADETQARFLNGIPDREGKSVNRTLVVDMESPRKTIQLKKMDVESDAKEIGLTIILSNASPNVIQSESCERDGIKIVPKQEQANFLFLAASCKMVSAGMRVSIETSHDAMIANELDETADHHFIDNPLVVIIPKKSLKPQTVGATVRVESENLPSVSTQFEIIYNKELKQEEEEATPPAPQKLITPEIKKSNLEPKPWLFSGELNLGYFGYGVAGRHHNDPSEFNLGGKFTTEHLLGESEIRFKADLDLPLVTLMPNAHFPASGQYTAQTRASFTVFDRGKIAFHLEPGLEASEEHLHNRSDVNGIYAGPVVAAHLSGNVSGLENRTMSLLAEASPLAGERATPYLRSWDWSVEVAMEMIKVDAEKHWDLVLRFHDLTLHEPSLPAANSTETTLGVRTAF